MYDHIMIPVDLAHADKVSKAMDVAASLAKQFGAKATIVGVTGPAPSAAASSPKDFEDKLAEYAAKQSAALGTQFGSLSLLAHDVAVEVDEKLEEGAKQLSADLIVMAAHVPGFADILHGSKGGYLARHAKESVFLVR